MRSEILFEKIEVDVVWLVFGVGLGVGVGGGGVLINFLVVGMESFMFWL